MISSPESKVIFITFASFLVTPAQLIKPGTTFPVIGSQLYAHNCLPSDNSFDISVMDNSRPSSNETLVSILKQPPGRTSTEDPLPSCDTGKKKLSLIEFLTKIPLSIANVW